jgi:hypothetical protein
VTTVHGLTPGRKQNGAALGGLVLGVIAATSSAFFFFIFFGGAGPDGPVYGSLLDRLGDTGEWLDFLGLLVALPATPIAAIAGVTTSLVGVARSRERGRERSARVGLALSLLGGIPFLAFVLYVWST